MAGTLNWGSLALIPPQGILTYCCVPLVNCFPLMALVTSVITKKEGHWQFSLMVSINIHAKLCPPPMVLRVINHLTCFSVLLALECLGF